MKNKWTKEVLLYGRQFLTVIMKTFIFCYCVVAFGLGSYHGFSQDARIKIDTDKTISVEQIFNLIENQTDYRFIYRHDLVSNAPLVRVSKGVVRASELLHMGLGPINYSYDFFNNTIIVKRKESISKTHVVPQSIQVEGVITGKDGEPIGGVTVYVSNVEPSGQRSAPSDFIVRGTTTDFDGHFSLAAEPGYFLVVRALGYEMTYREIKADQTEYNITLKEKVNALEEVMVVGYGTTKKKDLTGSVGSIDSEEIQQIKTQSVDQALVGKVAGVYVQNRSGQPGEGAFVQIRGLSQIRGDNQPLYVIDGVPINITPNGLGNTGGENPLLAINPEDIERVDVLKDASAAAIYGSRAANGVVIVTTKRGKRNQAPRFSFKASTTVQNPVAYNDYLDREGYIDWTQRNAQGIIDTYRDQLGLPDDQLEQIFPQQFTIVNNPDAFFGTANTDWQDLITNKNALWNEYSFNVSGGGNKVNYYTSLSVSDQDGVMLDNDFKRYSFSGNIDASVTDYLKISTSINYNYSVNKRNGFTSLAQGGFRPDLPAFNEDGTYTTFEGPYGEQFTVLGEGKQERFEARAKNLLGNLYVELSIVDGLRFRSELSVRQGDERNQTFNTSLSEEALRGELQGRPGARLGVTYNRSWSTTFTNTLKYNKSFGIHSIDVVAGISWDRNRYDVESQSYRGFPDDDILTNINSANFFDEASSDHLQQGLNSLFGRINYNYNDRYLATFTVRRDGSTKFGPDNRYGFFPSGALAWNVHNEDFLKENPVIDQLKLRASMGRVGSDNLDSFTYLAYYQSGSRYDGKSGLTVTGVPNTGIRWEATDQLDLGLEFSLFNSRLTGEIVYYEKNTSDIILNSPIPSETGSQSWNTNIADVSNKGWEFIIGGDIFRSNNLRWNSSLNLATVKNRVDNLYGGDPGFQTGVIEGQPLGVLMGFEVVKIAETQEEINDLNAEAGGLYQSSLTQPGDYIFRDITGDGRITLDDRGSIGNPNPDFFGGWNNQVTYKNWTFNMNWTFVEGVDRHFQPITDLYAAAQVNQNVLSLGLNTWSSDNPDAEFARPTSGSHAGLGGGDYTTRSIVDASYIKLRSASIGYNLPKQWIDNMGIDNLRLTLGGNNLIIITDYPGLDPEDIINSPSTNTTSFNVDNAFSYPNIRTYTLSVNLTF